MENRIYYEKFLSEDDYKYFLSLVLNEEVMVMNYGRVFTLEEAKQIYWGMLKRTRKHEDFGDFKVFEKTTNAFIGECALVVNDDFTEAELEYMLLPEYWGKRYGSEIASDLLKKAEEIETLQQITATIEPKNVGSRKILLNNGFESYKVFEIPDDGSLAESFIKKLDNGTV